MHPYTAQDFNIPKLDGISQKQIDEHLKLYQGYVKHVNKIQELVGTWVSQSREENVYAVSEIWRRLAFEFNGMRSHEYYFSALEGGSNNFDSESKVGRALIEQYGGFEKWKEIFVDLSKTRSSGWAILYYDPKAKVFVNGWVDEHHIGYLSSLQLILALDCWEHAYMVDYLPGERAKYVDAYLQNINWNVVNRWFQETQK